MGTLADALAATERGWAVVPVHGIVRGRCSCGRPGCASPGKHPRVAWQRFEHERPTVAQVQGWWGRWPDANIGVITGAVSGVVVVDVDPRNGGDATLAVLEARWGALPVTVETRTGGGGRHLWFRAPAVPLSSGPLAPGVDLKAEGGMVVVPPSVHHSGGRYTWADGRDPGTLVPADPPSWLLRLAAGAEGGGSRPLATSPARTPEEQREFAEAWARAGVVLEPGDRYYLCPFHHEQHPSLHIDAEGCRWFCFGCHQGGGIGRLRRLLGERPEPRRRGRLAGPLGPPGAIAAVTLPGSVDVEVVGESAHQDDLLALTGGRRRFGGVEVSTVARLVPDPGNAVDPEAVAVFIEGRPVGWLRRDDARRYHARIDALREAGEAATCVALIRGGWDRGGDDLGRFGVVLRLPPP